MSNEFPEGANQSDEKFEELKPETAREFFTLAQTLAVDKRSDAEDDFEQWGNYQIEDGTDIMIAVDSKSGRVSVDIDSSSNRASSGPRRDVNFFMLPNGEVTKTVFEGDSSGDEIMDDYRGQSEVSEKELRGLIALLKTLRLKKDRR